MIDLLNMDKLTGFSWDAGNLEKLAARGFSVAEVESGFLNGRGTCFPDLEHSETEPRFWLIGLTDDGRHITVPFTVRNDLVRPITVWTTKRRYRSWVR